MFYKKELKKINLKKRKKRIEKVIKIKCDKLHVKWKCHDNLFNN